MFVNLLGSSILMLANDLTFLLKQRIAKVLRDARQGCTAGSLGRCQVPCIPSCKKGMIWSVDTWVAPGCTSSLMVSRFSKAFSSGGLGNYLEVKGGQLGSQGRSVAAHGSDGSRSQPDQPQESQVSVLLLLVLHSFDHF